jgi:transcriptional regulator with XRE-family HTH domain
MTADELAERSGVARNTISRIERGVVEPQATTVHKLAEALGVNVAELLQEPVPLGEAPREAGPTSLDLLFADAPKHDERRAAAMFWVAYIRHVAGRIQAHVEDQDSPAFRDPQVAFFFVEEANHNAADLGRLVDEQASVALEVADVETMQDLFDAFAALGFAIGSASARARLLKAATPEDETARKRAEKAAAEREAVERELSAHLGHSA